MSTIKKKSIRSFSEFFDQQRAQQLQSQAFTSAIAEIATFIFTFICGTLFFQVHELILWLLPAIGSSLFVYYFVRDASKNGANSSQIRLKRSIVGAFTVGLAWGLFPLFFFMPDDGFYTVLIICIFTGFVSGGVSSTFAYSPSFYMFALGAYIPFFIRLLITGEIIHQALAALITVYIFTLCMLSRNTSALFKQTANANFEKASLVEELAYEKNVALDAVESKTKFLASASHDLRQPVNAIGLFANSLKSKHSNDKKLAILNKIDQSVNALNSMLHGFLEISRLDAGIVKNDPMHVRLSSNVNQILDDFAEEIKKNNVKVKLPANLTIYIDPQIFKRVVTNIIDNAIKYTPKGGIFIGAKAQNNKVRLVIIDSGVGISADKIDNIFNEFEQLNNPERDRKKGIGLGLSIARRLCVIGGINLEVSSKLGKGTRVVLEFKQGVYSSAIELPTIAPSYDLSKLVILVIEDEKDILEAMGLLIGDWGSQCILSESPQEALVKLQKIDQCPDLILSDYRLRNSESGLDAIEYIRDEYNSRIPAIVITGDTSPKSFSALEETNQSVLHKPIKADVLKQSILEIIESKRVGHS